MRIAALWLGMACAAYAQTIVAAPAAQTGPSSGDLRCQIEPIPPQLNFSFQFQAGYVVRVPLSQFRGPGHGYRMILRIEPEGGNPPVYLDSRFDLPNVPRTDTTGESAGSFLLGEGRYNASLTVRDDRDRDCHRSWPIEAKPRAGERQAKLSMPPGGVADLAGAGIARMDSGAGGGPRVAVLLHAAPVMPRASKVPPADVELLLGALSSLMHQAGTDSVSLSVFNLDQRQEIFWEANFSLRDLDKVSDAIYALQLAVVNYKSMQGQTAEDLISHAAEAFHAGRGAAGCGCVPGTQGTAGQAFFEGCSRRGDGRRGASVLRGIYPSNFAGAHLAELSHRPGLRWPRRTPWISRHGPFSGYTGPFRQGGPGPTRAARCD